MFANGTSLSFSPFGIENNLLFEWPEAFTPYGSDDSSDSSSTSGPASPDQQHIFQPYSSSMNRMFEPLAPPSTSDVTNTHSLLTASVFKRGDSGDAVVMQHATSMVAPTLIKQEPVTPSAEATIPALTNSTLTAQTNTAPQRRRVTRKPRKLTDSAVSLLSPSVHCAHPLYGGSSSLVVPPSLHCASSATPTASAMMQQQQRKAAVSVVSTSNKRKRASASPDSSDAESLRRHKHRMTDKDRRARIKVGIDQMDALLVDAKVINHVDKSCDRATVVQSAVEYIKALQAENAALRAHMNSNVAAPSHDYPSMIV